MSKRPDKNATRFSLAVYDDYTLSMLNELAEKFGNRNAVLNEALDIGVPQLYEKYFRNKVKTAAAANADSATSSRGVEKQLDEILRTMDDLFVEMNVQETMLAGLYNVKMLELDGAPPTSQALREGNLSDLPELVAGIKEDMTTPRGGKQ